MQVPPACRCLGDGAAVRSPWQPPRPPDTRGDSGGRGRRRRSERSGEESAGILSSQSGRCLWEWLPQRACEGPGRLCLQCSTVRARRQPLTADLHGSRLTYSAARGARRHPSISAAPRCGMPVSRPRRARFQPQTRVPNPGFPRRVRCPVCATPLGNGSVRWLVVSADRRSGVGVVTAAAR